MKSGVMMVAIVLIVIGVVSLAYQGISYTTREKVLQIGPIKATAEREKTIPLPPVLGGLALAGGVVLLVVGGPPLAASRPRAFGAPIARPALYHRRRGAASRRAAARAVKLPRAFYTHGDVVAVARRLLGQRLVVPARDGRRVSGIIVETEAYRGPEDRASHAYGGRRTRRTETMYAPGGTAYVYFVYGMYNQFNVVTNAEHVPHAVLVRALEPVEGMALMRRRRGGGPVGALTSGPGKLCIALGIDRRLDGADLLGDRVWIEKGRRVLPAAIASGPRIGIDYADAWVDHPWRFWLRGNPFVSRAPAARATGARVRRAGGGRSGRAPT